MGLFEKLFGTRSQRELKKIQPTVDKIIALEDEYKNLSEEALRGKTQEFKNRLAAGETLDDLLPEAFAAIREAADRVLGLRPYPVQLIGGIVLHQGRIAEMKTGEGKTLVAILPTYLNALSGLGHSEGCLFTLLIVSFDVQKLLRLLRSHLFIFAFISNILGGGS